jgi:hypothetical protein
MTAISGERARVRNRLCLAVVVLCALSAAPAWAHTERAGYWPDPRPDCSIKPCAGGLVPNVRSLSSALTRTPGTTVRVVCQPDSLRLLGGSIARAVRSGYEVRPTEHRGFKVASGRALMRIGRLLMKRCRYREIQPAITASANNDRVVILPGLYTEPTARSKPTHDPACDRYKNSVGAYSYVGELRCPNDANLIAVMGRAPGSGVDPDPPLEDRHGIPNVGPCIRCNLQVEGAGVSADDVVIEAGDPRAGNGGPSGVGHKKDVGVKVDRADGFVLRNVTVRHAREHGIYAIETDGYLLDSFKAFYADAYGVLTFVEDHGRIQSCDVAGSGDSGIYPGAGAKTNAGRDTRYYPQARYSQEIRQCDSHHNTGGYSGTDGAAVHVHHNNFYDNALGFTTDVFTAPGHPGFPQQGDLIENNNFYSNNFNPYVDGSDVPPYISAPVGTGLWIAGGNDNVLRNNRFWDNRRRGVMLFSSPDAAVCGPAIGSPVTGCDPSKVSTSYGNRFYANTMGIAPNGAVKPNGTDFWWDAFPGNTGNCWYANVAAPGRGISTSPSPLPDCKGGTDPASSTGTGDAANQGELVACLAGFSVSGYPRGNQTICSWTETPLAPSARAAARAGASALRARQRRAYVDHCRAVAWTHACAPVVPFGARASAAPLALPRFALSPPPQLLGLYKCADWRRATSAGRLVLVQRLRAWTGGPVEGDRLVGYGTVLPDGQAAAMFDERCRPGWARGLSLYKQYGFAAGFAGIAP